MNSPRILIALLALTLPLVAADDAKPGYKDTPMIPGTQWHVHDSDRPQPRVVTPAKEVGKPPADAIVLFDGTDLSKWRSGQGEAKWLVKDGAVICVPKSGEIVTKEEFGDIQLHIEFATPVPPVGHSQERGNSGIHLMGQFEWQVLDSFENPTYADGGAAAIYGQHPPLVNASRPSGEWQTYDIIFTAPRFKDGKMTAPAYVTGFHNGLLVHNHDECHGPTNHRAINKYNAATKGPIRLQDHGNTTKFRNIWVRPLKAEDGQ